MANREEKGGSDSLSPSPSRSEGGAPRFVEAGAEALKSGADRARDAVDHGVDAFKRGTDRAVDRVAEAYEKVEEVVDDAQERLEHLREKSVGDLVIDVAGLVRRHPGKALIISGFLGFVIGSAFRRRD